MADDETKESLTGGQLNETDGDEPMVSMSQAEFDEALANAGKEAVAQAGNKKIKNKQPFAVTTDDIGAREKAEDEARGNKKLPNNSKKFQEERKAKKKTAKRKADNKAERKKAKRKAAKK